ncbi:outer membrane beta-barrel protein [Bradyrhizobium sp. BEA-2-5]|uniref:outer membrane protein n=1 Tax=Bradyrhizobium sp. BEA-2-5 TaxID=3080015 RepID=UPI00293EB321|nr:outer membrane beta-barrel protein [Bradyrhizobium sp. BEA-2-5]WOH85322.1 outer membrane beta-barrel protein [Bradyrhizobium sp. BEA-2-5]
MRNVLLASAGMFALSAFAPAMAADMAARAPYVKAPPPAAIYNWTGFYVGGFGGYASENSGTPSMEGGFGGGTIGYNWQAGNIVYGLEVDAAGADIDASVSTLGVTARSKIDSLGTVRGRIGWAVNNVLFYGTGGYAWIDNKISGTAGGLTISDSKFHSGWTVGAGVEAFFAPQWSVKGEYLYRSLGSETYFGVPSGTLELHSAQFGVNYHFGGPIVAKY